MKDFFQAKKISHLVLRELNSTEATKLYEAEQGIIRIAQRLEKTIRDMVTCVRQDGCNGIERFKNDLTLCDAFMLNDYHDKQELLGALLRLTTNFHKMQEIEKVKFLVGSDFNPYFWVADAVTVPFLPGRPIVIKESAFNRNIYDFRPLVAHEVSHSLLGTQDFYMDEKPEKRLKDAYAYEQVF